MSNTSCGDNEFWVAIGSEMIFIKIASKDLDKVEEIIEKTYGGDILWGELNILNDERENELSYEDVTDSEDNSMTEENK